MDNITLNAEKYIALRLIDAYSLIDIVQKAREKAKTLTGMDFIWLVEDQPIIDAIPVGWLIDRANDPERAPLYRRYAQMLYEEWQKEQEAR